MKARARVTVVGSANTDMVVRVPRAPAQGETVLGADFQRLAGGKGANQAVAAARAGAEVTFVGAVGADELGQSARRSLEAEGIDVSAVTEIQDVASGVALIFVDHSGQNSIAVAPGANSLLSPAHLRQHRQLLERADIVVLQLEVPLPVVEEAARLARDAGIPVLLDPAPAQELPDSLLQCVSVLTPNEIEAQQLVGLDDEVLKTPERAARQLCERGCRSVIVTLGEKGAVWFGDSGDRRCSGHRVDAVDTTGAGDVFSGALAAELGRGRPESEALAFATAAAGLSVQRLGAQASAPRREEIEAAVGADGAAAW